ncbi:transcription factor Jun-like [Physella acuta]|uniref:transcription factor Jun-like n=1 Tax=Physella acuta TaxID=109671 RepID=UPI0027DCBF00|nr:transcription factor Jun-like [Physella acuta]
MEHSLYSDTDGPDSAVKKLKRSMTLDFNSSSATKQKKLATVLASPDLNMLKLASPELEKMIIQANGMVTTTPTPTQFIFPKFVTEEQEAYARGFVDALAELQSSGALSANRTQELTRTFTTLTVPTALSQSATVPTSAAVPIFASANELSTTTSLPGGPIGRGPSTVNPIKTVIPTAKANIPVSSAGIDARLPQIKDEPQTVPCLSSSPPLSPINMESQEKIKLERKRARNRVAARKCRTRKLERISRLEDRVKELKGQNNDLVTTATSLRDQVMKLKQQIVEHVNSGCQIMTQNMAF